MKTEMMQNNDVPSVGDYRERTSFLFLRKTIGEDERWFVRATWIEKLIACTGWSRHCKPKWEAISWKDGISIEPQIMAKREQKHQEYIRDIKRIMNTSCGLSSCGPSDFGNEIDC